MSDLAAGALRDLAAASPQGALKNAVLAQMGLSLVCSIYHADVSGVRPRARTPPSPSLRSLPPARPARPERHKGPASLGRGICVVRLVRGRRPPPRALDGSGAVRVRTGSGL